MDKLISELNMERRRLKNVIAELKLAAWETGSVSFVYDSIVENLEDAAGLIEEAVDLLAVQENAI